MQPFSLQCFCSSKFSYRLCMYYHGLMTCGFPDVRSGCQEGEPGCGGGGG